MNDNIGALISILHTEPPVASILAILTRGQEQRSDYRRLQLNESWKELAESCIRDIQSVDTDIRVLIGFMHEIHTASGNVQRAINNLARYTDEVNAIKNLPLKDKQGKWLDPAALGKILAGRHSPTFTAAIGQELVCHRRDAMLHLIQADINQGALEAVKFEQRAIFVSKFWENPQFNDLSVKVWQYEKGLNEHYAQIYFCIINNRPSLERNLYNLIDWVALIIRDLVTVQSTISLLLEHPNPKDTTNQSALSALSSRAGLLIRRVVASYLASIVSLLSINGITLNPEAAEVLSNAASRKPLFGDGIHAGKHTTIRRLMRIKKRMLVSLEGKISGVKFINGKKRSYSVATISDFVGDHSIQIVAPINLPAYGLRNGCSAKVSGFVNRGGSPQCRRTHLEIEKLKIQELYSQDIWVEAFRNLSTPYFNCWPENYHISFQITPTKADESKNDRYFSTLRSCDSLQTAYNNAVANEAHVHEELKEAQWQLIIMAAAVTATCAASFTVAAAIACAAAIAACAIAYKQLDRWQQEEAKAKAAVAKAKQDLQNCLTQNPRLPPPLTGSIIGDYQFIGGADNSGSSGGADSFGASSVPDSFGFSDIFGPSFSLSSGDLSSSNAPSSNASLNWSNPPSDSSGSSSLLSA